MFVHFFHFGVDGVLIRAHVVWTLLVVPLSAGDAVLESTRCHTRNLTSHTSKPYVITTGSRLHTAHSQLRVSKLPLISRNHVVLRQVRC